MGGAGQDGALGWLEASAGSKGAEDAQEAALGPEPEPDVDQPTLATCTGNAALASQEHDCQKKPILLTSHQDDGVTPSGSGGGVPPASRRQTLGQLQSLQTAGPRSTPPQRNSSPEHLLGPMASPGWSLLHLSPQALGQMRRAVGRAGGGLHPGLLPSPRKRGWGPTVRAKANKHRA